MRIKYSNPKWKLSEIANQLGYSTSNLQRYRNDINMLSPYRIQPNNTKRQAKKVSNTGFDKNSLHDSDVKRPQMASNDLKLTSNESIKNKRKKLKGDDPGDGQNDGITLIEQAFSSISLREFIEIFKKDVNIQEEISQAIDKYNKESFSTRSQIGQNAFIQSKAFQQARNIMGEAITEMDKEIEQKAKKKNKKQISEAKIWLPDSKFIEEMSRLDLNKISCKEKNGRIMNRLNKTQNHKYIEN